MSEATIYLRNGVTALVLSMIEDGAIDRNLSLRDPVRAIKEVSHDPTCRREIDLDRGGKASAVQVQLEYLELAQRYASGSEDPMTRDLLERWQRTLEALQRDPMASTGRTPRSRCSTCSITTCEGTVACTIFSSVRARSSVS
jgi:proteasome accessory factor A